MNFCGFCCIYKSDVVVLFNFTTYMARPYSFKLTAEQMMFVDINVLSKETQWKSMTSLRRVTLFTRVRNDLPHIGLNTEAADAAFRSNVLSSCTFFVSRKNVGWFGHTWASLAHDCEISSRSMLPPELYLVLYHSQKHSIPTPKVIFFTSPSTMQLPQIIFSTVAWPNLQSTARISTALSWTTTFLQTNIGQ